MSHDLGFQVSSTRWGGGGGAGRESVNGLVSWFSSTLGKGSCQGISGLGLFIRFCMI